VHARRVDRKTGAAEPAFPQSPHRHADKYGKFPALWKANSRQQIHSSGQVFHSREEILEAA